jgi:hypothetical protein
MQVLFERHTPDATIFDGILLADHNVPVLHLVNTNNEERGFSLWFDVNRLRDMVSSQVEREMLISTCSSDSTIIKDFLTYFVTGSLIGMAFYVLLKM